MTYSATDTAADHRRDATRPRSRSIGLHVAVFQHEPETGLGVLADVLDERSVRYELVDTSQGSALPDPESFDGAIVLGGSLDAGDPELDETVRWIRAAVRDDLPFLGICLGAQLLASALGAGIVRGARPRVGLQDVFLTHAAGYDPVFGALPRRLSVLGCHRDVFVLPRDATLIARSFEHTPEAFRFGACAYGLQFHLESRADDLERWLDVPGYRRIAESVRADWDAVVEMLIQATPELDHLARHVFGRWLTRAGAVAAHRKGRSVASRRA
jgi:GMP synthase-like glutamine amidotransferase